MAWEPDRKDDTKICWTENYWTLSTVNFQPRLLSYSNILTKKGERTWG